MPAARHTGSCQCGATAFEAELDLDKTFTCNCSRCRRLGSVLTFAPRSAFRLTAEGPSTEYLFNRQQIAHRFCPVCGIQTHAFGSQNGVEMVAVNVNCLDGVDARALPSQAVNGAEF